MSALISAIAKLFAPIVWFLTLSANAILRLLGIDPNAQDDEVSEEEIRMMVDVGSEKGAIDHQEKEFIQNVFEFDDLTAGEIATHRTDITLLWLEETMDDWKSAIQNSRHTLYPICDESVDNVVGILNAKADVLFRNMKHTRSNIAVVLDEYGGMSGIITINDLVEQLVGELGDDEVIAEDTVAVQSIDSNTWKIHGSASLEEVSEALGPSLTYEDCDTFNGLIFGALGAVTQDGSTVEVETPELVIKVTEIRDQQVETVIVCLKNCCGSPDRKGEKTCESD